MKSVSLLGLSLGILFILLTLQPQLELKRSQTREFLRNFKSAIVTSSRELVQNNRALDNDAEVKSYISESRPNMLRGAIHRNLSPGMIDSIFIFDSECNLIIASKKGLPSRNTCKKPQQPTGSFFWTQTQGTSRLNFTKELSVADKNYLVISQVNISGIWLDRFNRLPFLAKALQIYFDSQLQNNSSLLLTREGIIAEKRPAFGVYTKDPILNLLPAATTSKELSLNREIYWMSLLLLFISIRIIIDLRKRRDEQRSHIEKFNKWLTTLNPKLNPKESKILNKPF